MADNYLLYSELLPVINPRERSWCSAEIERIAKAEIEADQDCPEQDESSGNIVLDAEGVWFYSEEYGNPDSVAKFVQRYLREWKPDSCFSIQYAETCSKLRVGNFGGGAIFITAYDIQYINTQDWVQNKLNKFKA